MLPLNRAKPVDSQRQLLTYFLICMGALLIFVSLARLPPQRVGDGSEYYALFLAWKETLRPWMSQPSLDAYQHLFLANQISSLVPADWFSTAFPGLKLGATSDFNHFWLYSFLAFMVAKVTHIIGIELGPHAAFLVLHCLLFCLTGCMSHRLYGRRGLATFVLMILFSPMLWFYDKVHTEFITYCLTFMGVMLVFSKRYLLGALMFGLAATQNPSFALVAFVPFMYRFVLQRKQPFTLFEVCLAISTAFAVLAHPTYYFFRYGVVTPQLLAGGASLGNNLSTFYIWLTDPDLGLFPNWPVGVIMIVGAIALRLHNGRSKSENADVAFYAFLVIFLLINFYAHASTENLNSGATPGLARYSLWYLPVTFPVCLYVFSHLPARRLLTYPFIAIVFIAGVIDIKQYNPQKPENYTTPTRLSSFIQTRLPSLYNPPAEVFAERFSGVGELIQSLNPRGVLGPDCHKLLLFAGDGKKAITLPDLCMMDQEKVQSMVASQWPTVIKDQYVHFTNEQYNQAQITLGPLTYTIAPAGTGNFALRSGWFPVEQWGAWTAGKESSLLLPCNEKQISSGPELLLTLSVRAFGQQAITITQNDKTLFAGTITEPRDIDLKADTDQCKDKAIILKIKIQNPLSPKGLGLSNDARDLGIGLQAFTVKPSDEESLAQ